MRARVALTGCLADDSMYPNEAAWYDARTGWLHKRQEGRIFEWLSASLWLPVLLLRDRQYATYDRTFFGARAGQTVLAALGTLHTLVGAPPPPRRRIDVPEWLTEQDEADQRRCILLLDAAPGMGNHFLAALLEYIPGGQLARGWGKSEAQAMAIACALAHHTPRAVSDHAVTMRRMVSLLDVEQQPKYTACAGAALRFIGVAGLCQSRHAINRLLVEGSRPYPPVHILAVLVRFVGVNRGTLTQVRCRYTHRWDSPSLLLPPGISPQDEQENGETRAEGSEAEWQWLSNRVWNEDDEYAAAPVIVAICAILAIGWSEPQILLQMLAVPNQKQPAPAVPVAAPTPAPASRNTSHSKGCYERDPVSGKEVYHHGGAGEHGKRHGGGGFNPGGSSGASVLDGKLTYKVEPRLLQQIWSAIHHERTLFGKPCHNVRTFFDAADRDGSGTLTRRELSAAMVRLDMGLSPLQLDRMLSTIDAQDGDKDGLVQYSEFAKWLHGRLGTSQASKSREAHQAKVSNEMPIGAGGSNTPTTSAPPQVPFVVPSSLQVLVDLLDVLQVDGSSSGSLVCIGAARILSLMLSMATGTAPGVIGREGADRYWVATGVKSPLWTLLEVLNQAADLRDGANLTKTTSNGQAAEDAASAEGGDHKPEYNAVPSDSVAHTVGAAHRWVVQVVWLWLRDVEIAARRAAQRQDDHPEFVCGMASIEGVLDYLVRRSQGRSVGVAAALAVATYKERTILLQHPAGSSSVTTMAATRRAVDKQQVLRMEELDRAGLGSTGGGVSGAMCMLIGLGRQCAASYKSCGGLLPWVEYAAQHDGRGRRPPAKVLVECQESLKRADFIWLAANQSLQMYFAEGEEEVKQALRWRRRARKWVGLAQR